MVTVNLSVNIYMENDLLLLSSLSIWSTCICSGRKKNINISLSLEHSDMCPKVLVLNK